MQYDPSPFYYSASEVGPFTKKLVEQIKSVMRKNQEDRDKFQSTIIRGNYNSSSSKCKYCNMDCVWVETTNGWRLQQYDGSQHKCEQYKKGILCQADVI